MKKSNRKSRKSLNKQRLHFSCEDENQDNSQNLKNNENTLPINESNPTPPTNESEPQDKIDQPKRTSSSVISLPPAENNTPTRGRANIFVVADEQTRGLAAKLIRSRSGRWMTLIMLPDL